MGRTPLAAVMVLWLAPVASGAQEPVDPDSGEGRIPVLTSAWRTLRAERRATWVRPLSSMLVPGTGQLLAGKERGALYLIAEALLLTRFVALNKEGRRERRRYQDLALIVARGQFGPSQPDTAFEYFEQMGKFVESGPFDTDPGDAVVPPTDERTFNGAIWALARRTFFADPDIPPDPTSQEYQRALAFYTRRAVGPNFRWSWRNAGLEQDLFRQTIRASDEAFRSATRQLGLLLANHVLSAVDAFITQRLSRLGRPVEFRSAVIRPASPGAALEVGVTVHVQF